MQPILDIKDDNFENHVINYKEKPVIVDFWAPWCMPCKMQSDILDEFHQEFGLNVRIVRMNVDENTSIPIRYKISSIPTIIIFKQGKILESLIGVQTKEVLINSISNIKY